MTQTAATGGAAPIGPGALVGGRFLVKEVVSEDSLGRLLKAHDQKTGKPIALRVLPPGLLDSPGLEKLREHCRVAARLTHRNLAATYGVGGTPQPFVASEWVEGKSLSALIAHRRAEGRPMSLRGAYNVVAHVCRGLTAIHDKTCHGALRPEVVFVTDAGRVKITELGLDRALVEARGAAAFQPAEQASLAPEVKQGQAPTAASDIFGIGAILYQLLTGKSPADGFVPPSQAHPDATPDIDRVLLQCLAPDPAGRFASADEVRAALQPLVADAPSPDASLDFEIDVDLEAAEEAPAPGAPAAETERAAATPPKAAPPKAAPPKATPPKATPPKAAPPKAAPPRPPPPPAAGAPPKVGQRVSLHEEFRPSLAEAPRPSAAEVDLSSLLAKITENDAPRWMVVKDGLDHGPFSGRELVELIVKGEILESHDLMNMDTGERKPVKLWHEFAEFVEQQRVRMEEQARQRALEEAERSEARSGVFKLAVAGALVLLVAGGLAVFFATRESGGEDEVAEADLGDLYERGEIELAGTAGILPDPPRRGRRGMGSGGSRSVMAGAFVGSYEDAMNVAIELGDVTMNGGQGRLSPGDVQGTMNRHLNRIYNACVLPELRAGRALGNVTIDIAIAGSGQVMGVSARQGSGAFKSCIRRTVRGIRFPRFASPRMGARYSFSAN